MTLNKYAVILFIVLTIGCGPQVPRKPSKYHVGDIVYMKLDDRKGIVSVEYMGYYEIRLAPPKDCTNCSYTVISYVQEAELYQTPEKM